MKFTFDYVTAEEKAGTKVFILSNKSNLYTALEYMMSWCVERRYRVTGWNINK